MKLRLLITSLALALAACHHSPTERAADIVRFPPPVVKPDEAVAEKEPPTIEEIKSAEPGAKDGSTADMQVSGYNASHQNNPVRDTSKKIIREGDMKFKTGDLAQTRKTILTALKQAGGYLAQEREFMDEDDSTKNYALSTRIPAKNFDSFLSTVSSTAIQVDSKNISTTDVTTSYIDISTRLRNKKALETRYLQLLQKSNRMADILEVENKLNEIRTDIESTQGQLNYLMKQVAYSSLEITFYVKRPNHNGVVQSDNPIIRALQDGWELLQHLFFGIISAWPVWLIIAAIYLAIKRWRRKRREKGS